MTSNISSVSLRSGSNPRFPPGEDSNRNPKSNDTLKYVCIRTHKLNIVYTNVYDVSLFVDHDVAIVSVLDLE